MHLMSESDNISKEGEGYCNMPIVSKKKKKKRDIVAVGGEVALVKGVWED